jgi:hypothetical protein
VTDVEMYVPKGGVQGHAGQATMVEASRAEAEVRAQVVLARQFPRDVPAALHRIQEMFRVPGQADRAFYSYRKGGSTVSGSTIHLAKGVAQAWGNLTYGIDEMSRTPGQSEMRAWAWDLETNQRVSSTFIVEHAMDVKDGRKELTGLRDIYENNANMANRRLRAQIESVIPAYVLDMARETAAQTMRHGGGQPLPVRIAEVVKTFAGLGVELEQLERERERASGKWSELDLAHLRTLGMTISSGQMTVAEAFPPPVLTVDDVRPGAPVVMQPAAPVAPPREAVPDDPWAGVEYAPDVEQPAAAAPSEPAPWPVVAQPGGAR